MHALRTSRTLTRLVVAWFFLSLGVATASTIASPRTMQAVCADGGVVMLLVDQDGRAVEGDRHALDCPLCLPATLPAHFQAGQVVETRPLAHVLLPARQAPMADRAGAALPARGPPIPALTTAR